MLKGNALNLSYAQRTKFLTSRQDRVNAFQVTLSWALFVYLHVQLIKSGLIMNVFVNRVLLGLMELVESVQATHTLILIKQAVYAET